MKLLSSCKPFAIAVLAASLVTGCAGWPDWLKTNKSAGTGTDVTQAISAAKTAVAEAGAMGALWRDTESFLTDAEAAAAAGNNDTALKLANQARSQAELGMNQNYLEKAKIRYAQASAAPRQSAAQKQSLAAVAEAIRNAEGRKAYDLAQGM